MVSQHNQWGFTFSDKQKMPQKGISIETRSEDDELSQNRYSSKQVTGWVECQLLV